MLLRWILIGICTGWTAALAQRLPASWPVPDASLAAYFAGEVGRLESRCLADVQTLSDWTSQREERRRQLLEMLGLWPLPERSPLQPTVTGRIDGDDFVVEKLHFQSLPGLYVTGNLYLPKGLTQPAPAVLYVCGHAQVKTNNISYGNKTGYRHHGAWLARHGYVCLVIDTLQLGEIQGDHHGTYRLGQWWWNRRGYTPAGVEAWNGIRALDYLETRSEVDRRRMGMTGRSGGGSYTWTVAAIDERVRVAAPVAGITDLRNQVLDGAVEGHCDCMFFVNTYRWDFPQVAALIAPRPLLVVNTDADSIFPLDGVQRLFAKTRRLYDLHDAYDHLGLVIAPGPHEDSQSLQVPVLRWFDRHLKGAAVPIQDAAEPVFFPDQLRVFGDLPADQRNTRIQETFGPAVPVPPSDLESLRTALRTHCFAGWPDDPGPLALREVAAGEKGGWRLRVLEFSSQAEVPLHLVFAEPVGKSGPDIRLHLLDTQGWQRWRRGMESRFGAVLTSVLGPVSSGGTGDSDPLAEGAGGSGRTAWFAPRGMGPHAWSGDDRKQIQIRRRFQLLGQTADGMRVWDIRRALAVLRRLDSGATVEITGSGALGVLGAYAAAFEEPAPRLRLDALPSSSADEPDVLNAGRVMSTARLVEFLARP